VFEPINLVPPLLIVLGLVGLVFILKQTKKEEKEGDLKQIEKTISYDLNLIDKKLRVFIAEKNKKINNIFLNSSEKFLIRLRIIFLRVDRLIYNNLIKIKEKKNKDSCFEKTFKESIKKLFPEGKTNKKESKKFKFDLLEANDYQKNEINFLKAFKKNPGDCQIIKNLALLYLFNEDYVSARWILIEGYRLNKEDKTIQGLFLELKEKENSSKEIVEAVIEKKNE